MNINDELRDLLERIVTGATCNATISEMEASWNGIQELRQLLAQPSEPQGGEEVEVVAWLGEYENIDGSHYFNALTCERSIRRCPPDFGEPEPLMTVAQHRRLMAEQLERERGVVEALRKSSAAMKHAHESMFEQCLSNPVMNAWGKEVNVSTINDLQLFARDADEALAAWEKNHGK